jgi:hypothetical protein
VAGEEPSPLTRVLVAADSGNGVSWTLDLRRYEPAADCRCHRCGHARRLHFSPEQALRLALHEHRPLDPTPRPLEVLRVFL